MRYYELFEELVDTVDLFHGLDPETAAKIMKVGFTKVCEEGEYIFRKGDTGKEMYVILSGDVAIQDGERTIARLSQGDLLGEMALFSDHTRSADAVTLSFTELFILDEDRLQQLLEKQVAIRLLLNMVSILSARLRLANMGETKEDA